MGEPREARGGGGRRSVTMICSPRVIGIEDTLAVFAGIGLGGYPYLTSEGCNNVSREAGAETRGMAYGLGRPAGSRSRRRSGTAGCRTWWTGRV